MSLNERGAGGLGWEMTTGRVNVWLSVCVQHTKKREQVNACANVCGERERESKSKRTKDYDGVREVMGGLEGLCRV